MFKVLSIMRPVVIACATVHRGGPSVPLRRANWL
jgi:hypothetical protein